VSLPDRQAGICYTIVFGCIHPRWTGVSSGHAERVNAGRFGPICAGREVCRIG
jgi:hypothetical protein